MKCVFWFSLQRLSKTFLILRRIQRDIVINVRTSSWESNGCSYRILIKLEFYWQIFEKKNWHRISSKSVQWEPSCSMRIDAHTNGQTDMIKIIVALRTAKAPNKIDNNLVSTVIDHCRYLPICAQCKSCTLTTINDCRNIKRGCRLCLSESAQSQEKKKEKKKVLRLFCGFRKSKTPFLNALSRNGSLSYVIQTQLKAGSTDWSCIKTMGLSGALLDLDTCPRLFPRIKTSHMSWLATNAVWR